VAGVRVRRKQPDFYPGGSQHHRAGPGFTGGTINLGTDAPGTIPAEALQGTGNVQTSGSPPAAPFGLTLAFTLYPSKLPAGAAPVVYYYDDTTGRWVDIGDAVSDETITVTVDHFTEYAVVAKALPTPKPPVMTLKDIAGNWAQASINRLVSLGAITGYLDGTFRPDDITRAEFATVLVKTLKLTPKTGPVFADTRGTRAQDYVSTAAAYGIVGGHDASHFGPNDPVTRERIMVVRAAKPASVSGELTFEDAAAIDARAREDVVTAVKDGIVTGYPRPTSDGCPAFRARATRAVTVIAKILKMAKEPGQPDSTAIGRRRWRGFLHRLR